MCNSGRGLPPISQNLHDASASLSGLDQTWKGESSHLTTLPCFLSSDRRTF